MSAVKKQKCRLIVKVGEDGEVTAYDPGLNVYGVGDTIPEAVADFINMADDLFEELQSSENPLSVALSAQLSYLRNWFVATAE